MLNRAKYILRIDDCGWRPPKDKIMHHDDDHGLDYFRWWREAMGFQDNPLPVYYGFIPTSVSTFELEWLSSNLHPVEKIAVHGWDHASGPFHRGVIVPADVMAHGRKKLTIRNEPPQAYIAPFNAYDDGTLRDWAAAKGTYFFGGFPENTQLGDDITSREGLTHLPAHMPLYSRAPNVLARLLSANQEDMAKPRVITLHVTWDQHNWEYLRALGEFLQGKVIALGDLQNEHTGTP